MASDNESSPEPAAKKAKTADAAEKNEKGETFFKLSNKRRLTVLQFKGTTYVDIREVGSCCRVIPFLAVINFKLTTVRSLFFYTDVRRQQRQTRQERNHVACGAV